MCAGAERAESVLAVDPHPDPALCNVDASSQRRNVVDVSRSSREKHNGIARVQISVSARASLPYVRPLRIDTFSPADVSVHASLGWRRTMVDHRRPEQEERGVVDVRQRMRGGENERLRVYRAWNLTWRVLDASSRAQ